MMRARRWITIPIVALATGLGTTGPSAAQDADPLQADLERARQVHQSADQYDSIELLSDIITQLEGRDELTPEARSLLASAYFLRAEVHFNFGDGDQTAADLASAIRTEPNLRVDLAMISPKLAELLTDTRLQVVGLLESAVSPADAVAHVEGAPPLYVGGTISLLEGEYPVRIERRGYETIERTLRIPAGQTTRVEAELVRTSAVLHVFTDQAGVTVFVDGAESGVTAADADGNAALVIDGLQPGSHTVELSGRGFRNRKVELDLAALDDYATDVLALDPMRGSVKLAGLLPGSIVRVNGEEQSVPSGDSADLEVPAGDNLIEVDYGGLGRFIRNVTIADGQAVGFEVELRPVIALLGVLGGDERGARDLHQGLEAFFADSEGWSVADHSSDGGSVIAGSGLDVDRFRELSMASATQIARIDWSKLQQACDQKIGASAYMIAVLSDDLFASNADLWILPAAPHPALPQKIRTEVGGPEVVARVLQPISDRPTFARPWLGVRLIETNAAEGLVVLNVTAGSPAASAGLQPGDVITSARGVPVTRLAVLDDMLSTMQPHSDLQLGVLRPGGNETLRLVLGTSPMVLSWTDPDTFYPLYLGWLEIEEATGQSELEPWLIQLNQASAFMGLGSWSDAIQLLRSIQAPAGGGVGQGMVDYWLGMALIRTDPNQYRDVALQSLQRAQSAEAARLYHNDGPLVSPLAAAGMKIVSGGGS